MMNRERLAIAGLMALPCLLVIMASVTVGAAARGPDESIEWLPDGRFAHEGDPEYQVYYEIPATPWLDTHQSGGIVYLLFESPPRLERYDMNTETMPPDIDLPETPTAFTVDADGIYISFGLRTSRFDLDGANEVHLRTTSSDATELFTVGDYLYLYYRGRFMSVYKDTGIYIDSRGYSYRVRGIDVAPTIGKVFGRSAVGLSPSDIFEIVLNSDGTLGGQDDSPYHGAYPGASRTFVFPGEARVVDNSGIVYNTNDLTYGNSMAGSFDDVAFYGDLPIVLRDGVLTAYSNEFHETGTYTPDETPLSIFIDGEFIYSFFDGADGTSVERIPIELLEPDTPGEPVDPNGLIYEPDAIFVGINDVVYILSRNDLSIFRWRTFQQNYMETIPLIEAPSFMAYSQVTHRLYLAYPTGKITQIKLVESTSEEPFANSPQAPMGLSTAGEYVFVCDGTGAWASHYTYSPEGAMISQEEWNYISDEYAWSAANRKMYHFNDDLTPTYLLWENIDIDGVIGAREDSFDYGSYGIKHPIRVHPDGSLVVLGSGYIHDAISLEPVDALSNDIDDAAWIDGCLFTMRSVEGVTQLQKWGSNYGVADVMELDGDPTRMLATDAGLLVITDRAGEPRLTLWELDFKKIDPPFVSFVDYTGDCDENSPCFSSFAQAMDDAYRRSIIKVVQGDYNEDCKITSSKSILLDCGYDSTYSTRTSYSTINSLTIEDGAIIVENLSIGGP